jgi:hypothetical protein
MAISNKDKAAFECIKAGVEDGNLCLVECTEKETGKEITAVCGAIEIGDGSVMFIPVAKLFEGNPFEEIVPNFKKEDKEEAA